MTRPVLVTGGTGFLGGPLVRELYEHGHEVHVLARPTSQRASLADLDLRWHTGDLTDADSIDRAVAAVCGRGGAWLVHNAALISYRSADAARAVEINVEGTRRVVEAARRRGVERLVHVSSIVAVGHAVGRQVLDEESPYNGAALGVDYVDTKRAAEELALAAAPGLDVRVVAPVAVFGPAPAHSNSTRFIENVAGGRIGPLAPPGGVSVVGVEDVAAGIRLALERGRSGRRYILGESYLPILELLRATARELGVRGPRWVVPRPVWRALVFLARLVDRVRPLELATPQALTLLGLSFESDAARARSELGWRPRPFAEVLRKTVAHLRAEGRIA